MNIEQTFIKDLVVLTPAVFEDDRGYFFEAYNKNKLADLGIHIDFVQDNQSFSQKGTLRGLHYQNPPFAQTKLVRVLQGEINGRGGRFAKRFPDFRKTFWHLVVIGKQKTIAGSSGICTRIFGIERNSRSFL